jgi:dipeptidyl-peptidase-4
MILHRQIKTTNDNTLSAQVLNRHQDNLDLVLLMEFRCCKVVLNEKDTMQTDNLTFLKTTVLFGLLKRWFQSYLFIRYGKLKNQLTKGAWKLNYYGLDEKTNTVFYQSVENGSINRDVYRVGLDGKIKYVYLKIQEQMLRHLVQIFNIISILFECFTTYNHLNEAKAGKQVQVIENNESLAVKLKGYNLPSKEFFLKQKKGMN